MGVVPFKDLDWYLIFHYSVTDCPQILLIFNLFKKFYLQIRLRRSCFKYHCCCGEQQNLRESLKMLYSKKRIFTFVLTSWSAKLPYIEQSRDYTQHSTKYGTNLKKYCEFAFSNWSELTVWMWRKEKCISVLSYLHS